MVFFAPVFSLNFFPALVQFLPHPHTIRAAACFLAARRQPKVPAHLRLVGVVVVQKFGSQFREFFGAGLAAKAALQNGRLAPIEGIDG